VKKKNKKKYPYGGAEWSLSTMKFTFNMYDIFPTGAFNEKDSSGKQKNIEKLKILSDYCSTAHLQYKKYLLFYICYMFGAAYAYCNYSKIKFTMNEEFLFDQLNNFFKIVKKRYKNPKKYSQYLDFLDSLPLKKNVNLNKNFYYAHLPNLKKKHLLLIVRWFLDHWKKNVSIERVFYGAGHYISLEGDPILRDRKFVQDISSAKSRALKLGKKYKGEDYDERAKDDVTHKEMWESSLNVLVRILPSKFSKFKKSGLHKNVTLRMSYWYLANTYNDEINQCYLSSKYQDKFITNIITKGPNMMPYSLREFEKQRKKNEEEASN
jgi:hypothetical protein